MTTLQPLHFPESADATASEDPFPFVKLGDTAGESTPANRLQQLESMLKEAQSRAEIIEKEAYDKAYLAGEKAGMALGQRRGEQILEALQQSLAQTETELKQIRRGFAEAALDLATFMAGQILKREIQAHPEALAELAREAANLIPADVRLKVAVHPDDLSLFERLLENAGMLLVTDASQSQGSCRIVSEQRDVLVDPLRALRDYSSRIRDEILSRQCASSPPTRHDTCDDGSRGNESQEQESS